MQVQELLAIINRLPAHTPISQRYEKRLAERYRRKQWYQNQREHWQGWLAEYHQPGAYGRQPNSSHLASDVWNRLQCLGMLVWLAEAVGVGRVTIAKAVAAASCEARPASACALFRRRVQWTLIEKQMRGVSP